MSGPIQAGPKAIVWAHENRFSSKAATRVVPIKGLDEKSGEMCGEYVCVSEKNILGKKLSCPAFGSFSMPGDPCFAQKFVYYTLDRFVRLLAEKLV
ncbi:MAG TPA: hypothetical protein PLZ86_08615, partial [bacterium]|nr:hypothetical protein [bacterium]